MPTASLILFDIDATLLVTGGAGVAAMVRAGADLFGPGFHADGIDFAGRLDPILLDELMTRNGVDPTPSRRQAFRERYRDRLGAALAEGPGVRRLPGVHELLDRLASEPDLDLGLLTGNFESTGRMKLQACDIDPRRFGPATAWGDDSPHDPPCREHLPPVAMRRFEQARGESIGPSRVVIIGDTPHDVRCARVNGCRSVAVATGKFSEEELSGLGADAVLPDLSETEQVARILRSLLGTSD